MKKIIAFSAILSIASLQAQDQKIPPGNYMSNSFGTEFKLRLTDDKKYEMVIFHGDYQINNDTIVFNPNAVDSDFAVNFSNQANPSIGKIKVTLSGNFLKLYSSAIYFGTQNGTDQPVYKSFSDLKTDLNEEETEASFEIIRTEFMYLVSENYNGLAKISKYKIPKNQNQINIQYAPNNMQNIKLIGYKNEKNELVVTEKNKFSPLIFSFDEGKIKNTERIAPEEITEKKDWTFPGKYNSSYEDDVTVVDTAAVGVGMGRNTFKFSIAKKLQSAMENARKSNRYLVVSYDIDNKNNASDFKNFIHGKQSEVSYFNEEELKNELDFEYYNATSADQKWAQKNNLNSGSTAILDKNGNVLATINGNVSSNTEKFSVYNYGFTEQLDLATRKIALQNALVKKNNDAEILKVLAEMSNWNSWSIYPPMVEEVKVPAPSIPSSETHKIKMVNIDEVKVSEAWNRLVNKYSSEKKYNNDFAKVAIADVAGQGFYYQLFDKSRPMDDNTWKMLDYLLLFPEEIIETDKQSESEYPIVEKSDKISDQVGKALRIRLTPTVYGVENKDKLMAYLKKSISGSASNYQNQLDYFAMIYDIGRDQKVDDLYLDVFDKFHQQFFENQNEIVVIDKLYSQNTSNSYYAEDWANFKNKFANAHNQAAWYVVEKVKDLNEVKRAIKWSETSLRIEKDNPYYLDTLAQLLYKNGEKTRAISVQEKALKNASYVDDSLKSDMQEVLIKMKNGTY
ncbi:hypothetical protein GV828_01350 [Flavobacterium sp. NST-5]|uniref:Tetratricopeptide repeat protein n=1 Tax=Flavobacterium ichthyis TaxID=2698827 RepID=A0ABW9Z5B1_9FLAO|nr:hypothetical protein [Flavobacterium ichthyis]NBL63839.1 hypothetical protein [Flavobacterium ichthyis]